MKTLVYFYKCFRLKIFYIVKLFSFLSLCLFQLILLSSCNAHAPNVTTQPETEIVEVQEAAVNIIPEKKQPLPTPEPIPTNTPDPIDEYIKTMTIDEKVGQMFICAFRYGKEDYINLSPSMIEAINYYHLGGVALFSENIINEAQTKKLIDDLQEESKTPLFITVDEEGGRVSRLSTLGYEKLVPALKVGASGDTAQAYSRGKTIAENLKKTGFNMDFAPVADLNTNPKNTVIGNRAFGSDPEAVGDMISEFVKGMESEGILSVLKHFPGHGDTEEDSHYGNAVIPHSLEKLNERELVPFKMGIDAGADVVMVGHMSAPNITGNDLPCIFSQTVVTGVLREQLDFKGIIITDALDMGAIVKYTEPDEAAVKAVLAGVDVLLMPHELKIAYKGIMDALENGVITESRIDESLSRILQIKKQYGILE